MNRPTTSIVKDLKTDNRGPGPTRRLYDAGFRDLIPVIPPRAHLSPQSTIDPSQRGKVPGKKISSGWCGFTGWPNHTATLEDTETWDEWGSNVGMKDPSLPGIDLDIDDGPLCDEVFAIAQKTLGKGPTRLSKKHRRLIVCRTKKPFGWMGLRFEVDGQRHLVEILGEGSQYLIHGTHPSGAQYRWEGRPLWQWDREEIPLITPEMATGFLEEISSLLRERGIQTDITGRGGTKSDPPPQEDLKAPSLQALAEVVGMIPNPADWGWHEMIRMGYAIRAAGQDDPPRAEEIWLEWTDSWELSNDPELDRRNWSSFRGPFRAGWSWLQSQAAATGKYHPAQHDFEVVCGGATPEGQHAKPRLAALQEMNETYAVVQLGSDVVILQEQADGEVAFLKTSAFSLKFKNRKIPSETDLSKREPLATAWLAWANRREYDRVVFQPGELNPSPSEFNLWRGWALEPDPTGRCDLFLKHLLEVVCRGNKDHYEWLLDWMAHMIQYPELKPGIAVALKGGQGAGKSIVGAVLKKLLGKHHVIADKSDQVTGRFNGHLAHCLLLQAEEAFWGGNKDSAGALKHLVTGEHFRIERKGIDSVEMVNFTRLLITTNEDWVWPTSIDDRRLAIFDVSNDYVGEPIYFEVLFMELMELGGYGKLLHLLQERKLSSSRLRNPPTTTALHAQAAESMPPEEVWLFGLLSNGEIQGRIEDDGRAYVPIAVLYDDYCASIPRGGYKKSSVAFANFLQEKLQAKNTRRRPRVDTLFRPQVRSFEYQVPPLEKARALYSQRGRAATQEWDEPNHWIPVSSKGFPALEPGAPENPKPDNGK